MPNPTWAVTSHALTRRGEAEGLRPEDPCFTAERERLRVLIPEEVEQARPLRRGRYIFNHPMRRDREDRAEYRLYQGVRTLCYVVIGRAVITTLLPDDRQLETLEQLGELDDPPPASVETSGPLPGPPPDPLSADAPAPTDGGTDLRAHPPGWLRKLVTRTHLLVDRVALEPPEATADRLRQHWMAVLGQLQPAVVVCSESLLPALVELFLARRDRTPVTGFPPHPRPRAGKPYLLHPEQRAWWEGLGAHIALGKPDFVFLLVPKDARRFCAALGPRRTGTPKGSLAPLNVNHPGTRYQLAWDLHEERLLACRFGS